MSKTNKFHFEWEPTRGELGIAIACTLIIGFLLSFAIIAFSPLRNIIPGYPNATMKHQMVQTAMRMDSLQQSIDRWELYSANLRKVIEGGKPLQIDSIIKLGGARPEEKSSNELSKTDSVLRYIVEEQERFEVSDRQSRKLQIEGLHFFKPLNGTVSHHYDIAQHPYIDVTAPEGSTVKSVLDGAVVYADWTEKDGWCMVIQHESGILSIYKHNQKLLKKVADKVSAGTSIALLGADTTDSGKGVHLHFELWQNGTPVDPVIYIKF